MCCIEVLCFIPDLSENRSSDTSERKATKRPRTTFTAAQLAVLKYVFNHNSYPDVFLREEIHNVTKIENQRIVVWFQNRRARFRKTCPSMTSPPAHESSIPHQPVPPITQISRAMLQAQFDSINRMTGLQKQQQQQQQQGPLQFHQLTLLPTSFGIFPQQHGFPMFPLPTPPPLWCKKLK